MCWASCSTHRWMTMEGSSESGWHKSESSRGLSRLIRANRISFSGDESRESGLIPEGEESNRIVLAHTDHFKTQVDFSGVCEDEVAADPFVRAIEWGDVSLRQWLDKPERSVDAFECLHIFRQIVEIVNMAHSQGIVVHNVRPSCFVMSSFNHVSFIESASCSDSGSDSLEDGMNNQTLEVKGSSSLLPKDSHRQGIALRSEDTRPEVTPANASQMESETSCALQSNPVYATCVSFVERREIKDSRSGEENEEKKQAFPLKQILLMECSWYTSPEEVAGAPSCCASDIYRLGVLLFELFCAVTSREEKSRTMSSMRHRVLPPQLLLKWPKEASFCLWLLHPDPNSRPTMGDLLQSEFLNEPRDNLEEREAAIELQEKIEEQELLLEFLLLIQQRKQEAADKLQDTISLLSSDIEEVTKQQTVVKKKGGSFLESGNDNHSATDLSSINIVENDDSATLMGSRKRFRPGVPSQNAEELDCNLDEGKKSDTHTENQESIISKSSRLMKNFKKLESAYLLTRRRPIRPSAKPVARYSPISSSGKGSVVITERSSVNNAPSNEPFCEGRESGWINPFLEGLCKYLSFSKLKVKADLKQGDVLNSSNLVCSISFDRDGEFFATAGVNKKIKVFEFNSILNEEHDIHYPMVEMASKSKLSSICWNSYIKSQIASSNFEGVVQVWDITRSQALAEMREHESRVWSIDFSLADPTLLASGSDDGSVKLWNINQAILFLHLVDVSFETKHNTLKLWDLSMCTSRVLDSPLQSFTGHMNLKNFVGLSVSEGYIATGSETNEVFIYHKGFAMPMLSFKFNSTDLFFGQEMDDAAQFISSVCWRGQSSTLVAANSKGNIKILEMV
ncbi:protein SPA1-RELATED 3-like isoform X2 [Malania oleifera]|uniref:protein SPA1-RELATED 3-like isoform X2 n=1 Tax=Malania oleifera TaxID=397392 RepID=UPI0025AE7176|nr:protein SPA1-RELATED 3-like isoform X2 [Malania oleifera]XP_057960635.1 protein SPA1-RELATED 3-like isoform X2 [Malania oleifera]